MRPIGLRAIHRYSGSMRHSFYLKGEQKAHKVSKLEMFWLYFFFADSPQGPKPQAIGAVLPAALPHLHGQNKARYIPTNTGLLPKAFS